MKSSTKILIASADVGHRMALESILTQEGWETICVSRLGECPGVLARENIEFVFCDSRLADGTYRDLLTVLRAVGRQVKMVVTSRLADWDEYTEALEHGAFELIASPCRSVDVLWAVNQSSCQNQQSTCCGPATMRAPSAGARLIELPQQQIN